MNIILQKISLNTKILILIFVHVEHNKLHIEEFFVNRNFFESIKSILQYF